MEDRLVPDAANVWLGPLSQAIPEGSTGGVYVYRSGGDTRSADGERVNRTRWFQRPSGNLEYGLHPERPIWQRREQRVPRRKRRERDVRS